MQLNASKQQRWDLWLDWVLMQLMTNAHTADDIVQAITVVCCCILLVPVQYSIIVDLYVLLTLADTVVAGSQFHDRA